LRRVWGQVVGWEIGQKGQREQRRGCSREMTSCSGEERDEGEEKDGKGIERDEKVILNAAFLLWELLDAYWIPFFFPWLGCWRQEKRKVINPVSLTDCHDGRKDASSSSFPGIPALFHHQRILVRLRLALHRIDWMRPTL